MPDGSLRLDVRATIKTDDGEIIMVTYSGAFAASKEVNDRFNNGEVLSSKDAYFINRTSIHIVETGNDSWRFKNRA